jgi:hypothetical protein
MSIRAVHVTRTSSGRLLRLAAILLAVAICLPAQHKVDARQLYERLYCVVPMIGTGTWGDPKRPLYAPSPAQMNSASRSGIIGFTHVLSDDGQFALVEFVARDAKAFDSVLADININLNTSIKAFRKGKDKREDIEAEFRKHKKDFSFDTFGVRVP